MTKALRIKAPDLETFIMRAFEAVDVPSADARLIAELMVRADVNGSEGHGAFRLPQYIRRIKGGAVNVRPHIRIEREAAGMALVNGDNGMGHLVMRFATQTAIEKAKQAGVAWVGAKWSNHAGPASLYASMPLEHDMIGLYLAVGSANHMPPWGGLEMLLSTNPLAVAVPAGEEPPIVLDMATTVAAYGKVKTRAQRGEAMPIGWMMDRQATADRSEACKRRISAADRRVQRLRPRTLVGLLAGNLNGAAMGRDVVDFNADDSTPTNTGHAIVAISVAAFGGIDTFRRTVDLLARDLRASKRLPGVERIWVPGEQSHAKRAERTRLGVPLPRPFAHEPQPARGGTADATPGVKGLDGKCRISL